MENDITILSGEAHKAGFSTPYLANCLYILASGKKVTGPEERGLSNIGCLKNGELSKIALKFLDNYLNGNRPQRISISAQEIGNADRVEQALSAARAPACSAS